MSSPSQTRSRIHAFTLFIALGAFVYLTRVPFLSNGYGSAADAWRVVSAAQEFARTGIYRVSRAPGFPGHEIPLSLVADRGPFVVDSVAAVMSGFATIFFALTLKRLGSRDYWLGALALAFVPVVYIASTGAQDFVWGLAFILAALYATLTRRYVLAGICIGVAIASRLTAGGILLPLAILLWFQEDAAPWFVFSRARIVNLLELGFTALVVSGLIFLTVLTRYGVSLFRILAYGYPSPFAILERVSIETWGVVGALAIGFACLAQVLFLRTRDGETSIPRAKMDYQLLAWSAAIVVYVVVYLLLPHRPAYLIPLVPFILLLLARVLERRRYVAVCVAMLVSPFVFAIGTVGSFHVESSDEITVTLAGHEIYFDALMGPLGHDNVQRIARGELTAQVVSFTANANEKAVLVLGEWQPQVTASLAAPPSASPVHYVYYLCGNDVEQYRSAGYAIYYLPGQDDLNKLVCGVDLHKEGAKLFAGNVLSSRAAR